jgi:hypothetical protein
MASQVGRQIQFSQDLIHVICRNWIALQLRELLNFRQNLFMLFLVKGEGSIVTTRTSAPCLFLQLGEEIDNTVKKFSPAWAPLIPAASLPGPTAPDPQPLQPPRRRG